MDEDLLTCGFCRNNFNGENRKPKFLPCRHHTLCLQCIKEVIASRGVIRCPTCHIVHDIRMAILPENSYVQYILELKTKMDSAPSKMTNQNGPSWCLTCDSIARPKCNQNNHGLLNLTISTIKNVERLVSLKNQFKSMKDRLGFAIEKRKEIQSHFAELLDAVKSVEEDILFEVGENDHQLTDWTALMEKNCMTEEPLLPLTAAALDLDEYFLSELVTFVGHSRPDGTLETLKRKIEETALDYATKLKDITIKATKIEEQRKMRICVRLSDPSRNENVVPIGNVLCDGFVTNGLINEVSIGPIGKASLLLFSHIVFTLHKHRLNPLTPF